MCVAGSGELSGGEDVVVAVAVVARSVAQAEDVAAGAVDGAVGVGGAVLAQPFDYAAFSGLPASRELGAQRGGAGVLRVADASFGVLAVEGVDVAAEDVGRAGGCGHGAVGAIESLELFMSCSRPSSCWSLRQRVLPVVALGTWVVWSSMALRGVVDAHAQQPLGHREATGAGVEGLDRPAAGDEKIVGMEASVWGW